jgi:altronate dehydratase large subunit
LTSNAQFDGYRRSDGGVGVRNHVLVLSPTGLTSAAAQRIAHLVAGTVAVTSGYGRGQVGEDERLHFATLSGLACHPNVAGVLVVSAADAITEPYLDALRRTGNSAEGLSLPSVHEDALTLVDRGVRAAARLVRSASSARRTSCTLADLFVAVECGHSDATSGLVCNPLCGALTEAVVAAGGRAVFSETVEWTGAEHLLARRAASPHVAHRIVESVLAREHAVRESGGDVRAENPGPQNKTGGLTTIEEKALGAIAKGGEQPVQGVLGATESPRAPGLYLMDTPFFSPESITAMVAAGAQMVLFTTGAGNSYCSAVAPTLKVSANAETCTRLSEQIDVAAAGVLDGRVSFDEARAMALDALLDTASGTLTFGEIVGEGSEVVSRIGASM